MGTIGGDSDVGKLCTLYTYKNTENNRSNCREQKLSSTPGYAKRHTRSQVCISESGKYAAARLSLQAASTEGVLMSEAHQRQGGCCGTC